MSTEVTHLLPEQVCYVHCNFCNTVLAVNIPSDNMFNIVTVRCGHCANLLSVDMGGVVETETLQNHQKIQYGMKSLDLHVHSGPVSECSRTSTVNTVDVGQQRLLHNRPPEKRQRVPSAYNKFIKEEIQRIKASNPDISHREAFSAAAKNVSF
ncbi:Protein YABBY 2 [Dendrobium catenatum]|uniref:Protein YABBY 2 n=1 Tax=Dendrobium catenatum TaxID=906689 RepID=A0A2I0VNK5_9ASPA|nr:Protein YABBY 2 [Dendrobium catenatum]